MDGAVSIPKHSASSAHDESHWADRCRFWQANKDQISRPGRARRHLHEPLVLTGHGLNVAVKHGALLIKNGFTHYPHLREEFRYYPADARLPSRIIIVDGSGSLTLDAIEWLSVQRVPLIRVDWRGKVQTVIGGMGFAIDPKKQQEQLDAVRSGRSIEIATNLIIDKIENSIDTLQSGAVPRSRSPQTAIETLRRLVHLLGCREPSTIAELLNIEAQAAVAYFGAWRGIPLNWKGTKRSKIPDSWYHVGHRSAGARLKLSNRFTRHPVNAILNYAYAILESQVRIQVAAEGYDPNIGYLHRSSKERPALVFDLMEPQRPIIDRKVLEFVQAHTFCPADFTIRSDGVCRLNPEMARQVAFLTAAQLR